MVSGKLVSQRSASPDTTGSIRSAIRSRCFARNLAIAGHRPKDRRPELCFEIEARQRTHIGGWTDTRHCCDMLKPEKKPCKKRSIVREQQLGTLVEKCFSIRIEEKSIE